MARRFTGSQRAELFARSSGMCSECGKPLPTGWHADHAVAYAHGGKTTVSNGRSLCPQCNLKKGASRVFRTWQLEAFSEYDARASRDFLIEATPGAGKTMCAAEIARRAFASGKASRLIVVVPTAHLKTQWADALHQKFGIDCEPNWPNGSAWPRDMQAVAVTYSQVAKAPNFFAVHARGAMVVLDEVHHAGGDLSFARGLREGLGDCTVRLLLSGTPFRSDNNEIPFVRYVDGQGAPDFRYSYADALRDGVCRCLFFPRRGGKLEWERDGRERSASFDEALSRVDASDRLRTALDPDGNWIGDVLRDANARLLEMREEIPSAAGIVLARDVNHAQAIARRMRTLGVDPVVVTSSDEEGNLDANASRRIKSFQESTLPWVVSVRMVSEGVDIPRLRVAVYCTNVVTPMFFRQAVGRVVRAERDEERSDAWVYIPDDPRLRAMAQSIEEDVIHHIEEEGRSLQAPEPVSGEQRTASTFSVISSKAEDKGVIVNGHNTSCEDLERFEQLKLEHPQFRSIPAPLMAQLEHLLSAPGHQWPAPSAEPVQTEAVPSKATRKASLRKRQNKLVSQLCAQRQLDHKEVNRSLNTLVGIRSIKDADESQLEQRLEFLRKWISSGVAP